MTWENLQLIVDFGLVVLIWMVQLLIYPSFKHFTKKALMHWHKRYTLGMAFIVIPLMFTQLLLALFSCIRNLTPLSSMHVVLVLSAWVATSVFFVPIHKKLSNNSSHSQLLDRLVNYNWFRVIIWNVVFIISVIEKNIH